MAERSGFFNAVGGDRIYKAEDFAEYFSSFITNGVFPNPSTNLQVMSNNDMTVILKAGKAWINGYIYINDSDKILNIDVADGLLNRIDRIVLQLDKINRQITAVVKKGQFSTSPVAPELIRNADYYELGIADIYVGKGITSINQSNITDLRMNTELCGWVNSLIQVDTTTLFDQYLTWYQQTTADAEADIETIKQQFENDFNAWFANLQTVLNENTAANLYNMIGDTSQLQTTNKNSLVEATNEVLSTANSKAPVSHMHTKGDITDFAHNHAVNEITDLFNELNKNLLYYDSIKGTTQYPTFDSDGNITKIEHKDTFNNTLRTDTFTYTPTLITETRALTTGETLTLKYYFDTNGNYLKTEVI